MKPLFFATKQYFREIWDDAMLSIMLFAPILMGLAFRFAVPALESFLCAKLNKFVIIAPYYFLFDLLLLIMTPIMFAFAGVMVILAEADVGLTKALAATPLGKNGYLLSRIGIPALLSVIYGFGAINIFHLTQISRLIMLALSVIAGLLGVAISLMVASIAKNKVEGLALSKLSGLAILGLPAALLVPVPAQYIAGLLPPFWMVKVIYENSPLFLLPAGLAAVLWVAVFWRRFIRKLL